MMKGELGTARNEATTSRKCAQRTAGQHQAGELHEVLGWVVEVAHTPWR